MVITKKIETKKDFYITFLELLTVSKGFNVTSNDIKVLAHLYTKHDDLFNDFMKEGGDLDKVRIKIGKYILSTEIRKEISKSIKISTQSFNNSISKLRKEGIIDGSMLFYFGLSLHTYMYKNAKFDLTIKFDV